MNSLYILISKRLCYAIIAFLYIFPIQLSAAQYIEEASSQEYLFTKGKIRDISLANQSITIQQKDGKRITVLVNTETEFNGFGKLEELQNSNVIKVWYRQEVNGNVGLKILKLPELGC